MSEGHLPALNTSTRPDYLADIKATTAGADAIKMYAKPPIIKVIQAQTGAPFKPPFAEGDVIITPNAIKIGGVDEPFTFTPIYFFPSWVCWNPVSMKGTLNSVREYSLNPNHQVAIKYKSRVREEPCPENPKFTLKYQEFLNFIVIVQDNLEVDATPVTLSAKGGEYKYGQQLIAFIQQKLVREIPMQSCRFQASVGQHTDKGFTWKGLDFSNDPTPFVDKERFLTYDLLNKEYDALYKKQIIEIDYSGVGEEETPNTGDF